MDGLELFGDSSVDIRYDLGKFDPVVAELHKCIQQMIGKHMSVLRKELQSSDEFRHFSHTISTIYRLLCVHEYQKLEKEASKAAEELWTKMLNGFSHIVCCKEAFLITQVVESFASLVIQLADPLNVLPDQLLRNIQKIDRAHIMGAPVLITSTLHQQFELIRHKNQNRMKNATKCNLSHSVVPETFDYDIKGMIDIKFPIARFSNKIELKPMSIGQFQQNYYDKQLPVILQHTNEHWKSFEKWRDLSMWCREFGHRLIPIEIGKLDTSQITSHSLPEWKESTFTFRDYIHQFIDSNTMLCTSNERPESLPNDKIGYLAQHHLFDQFPQLQEDFDIPPYCKVSQTEGEPMEHVQMNAWFGTQDTVTSLHFDSYDNFLTQVFGYKYVRLYAPSESEALYPIEAAESDHSVAKQNNISPVDVANPNLDKYPQFKDAAYTECILGPRDMLYIPRHYWHYVRSLSPSFSVNFWF